MLNRKNKITVGDFTLEQLTGEADFKKDEIGLFDCDDCDLNDFFRKDAYVAKKELLAETYSLQIQENITQGIYFPVAFVSLLNDQMAISKEVKKENPSFKQIFKKIPNKKRLYKTYPAVKIGRLGVVKQYQKHQIGTSLLNILKKIFVTNNRTGCRFLSVDSYKGSVGFYKENGFFFYDDNDKDEDTRIMCYDLKNSL
jgi:GNAT superfamily N-acetyltransferase